MCQVYLLFLHTVIVSDCPRSSFKSVGICPIRLESISHPDRALRGAIMVSQTWVLIDQDKTVVSKNIELPQAGLRPTTFCILGRCSTNWATEAATCTYFFTSRHITITSRQRLPSLVEQGEREELRMMMMSNYTSWPTDMFTCLGKNTVSTCATTQ